MSHEDQEESVLSALHSEISERIQELRRAKKWTIEQLSEASGYATATLKQLFGGRGRWNADHLARIAGAFGVQPRDLLPGGPPPLPAFPALDAAVRAGDAPAALQALADALRNQHQAPTVDADELRMLEAMRARNPKLAMAILAGLMEKWE